MTPLHHIRTSEDVQRFFRQNLNYVGNGQHTIIGAEILRVVNKPVKSKTVGSRGACVGVPVDVIQLVCSNTVIIQHDTRDLTRNLVGFCNLVIDEINKCLWPVQYGRDKVYSWKRKPLPMESFRERDSEGWVLWEGTLSDAMKKEIEEKGVEVTEVHKNAQGVVTTRFVKLETEGK